MALSLQELNDTISEMVISGEALDEIDAIELLVANGEVRDDEPIVEELMSAPTYVGEETARWAGAR